MGNVFIYSFLCYKLLREGREDLTVLLRNKLHKEHLPSLLSFSLLFVSVVTKLDLLQAQSRCIALV